MFLQMDAAALLFLYLEEDSREIPLNKKVWRTQVVGALGLSSLP